MAPGSLLQDVLKQQLEAVEDAQRRSALLSPSDSDEDETIDVVSGAATPLRSKAATRSSSPSRAKRTTKPSPLSHSSLESEISSRINSRDPLRILPDKIRPVIFCFLSSSDLAACTLVCQRWKKSQTINHAWYQLYRHETYQFSELPVGKWTKRESKKDWRTELIRTRRIRQKDESATPIHNLFGSSSSRSHSNSRTPGNATPDGYLTPRELKEEEWDRQNQIAAAPDKVSSRNWYKEMGGKRVKKTKTGMTGGMRDRTAWEE